MFILYKKCESWQDELPYIKKYKSSRFITDTPRDSVIVGRYSVMPYYSDVEEELRVTKNSCLINSVEQHNFITGMEWIDILDTFPTYINHGWSSVPDCDNGWVVKGKVNSRKFRWNTHMRAKTREELKEVSMRLSDDLFIFDQGLVIREYVELEKVDEEGINGLPITNEWRFFFCYGELVDYGFYWPYSEEIPEICQEGIKFAQSQADLISDRVNFFVIDIAKKKDGEWIVVEINDGQMSGLSEISPESFYYNLNNVFNKHK